MPYPKQKSESYNFTGGINRKASLYGTAETEQLNIVNMNFVTPGSLTKRPGSDSLIGATVQGRVGGIFEFSRLNGASYVITTANTNVYTINSGSWSSFRSGLLNNGIFDFVPFVDRLFMANGQDFFKTDGSASSNFSLPPGYTASPFSVTAALGGGLSGVFVVGYGYLNDRGYYGPPCAGYTVTLDGATFGSVIFAGLAATAGFGITAFAFYRSEVDSAFLFGTTQVAITAGSTFTDNAALSTREAPSYQWFTMAPRYLELYNNQMFLAGMSQFLSTVYFSDIGEPEGVLPEYFIEVRTNDGDRITGLKSYAGALMISKFKSIHRLSGEDPTNFTLQEISDQFGCLSNRAMVTYNDVIEWLDSKGIVRFNGANIGFASNRIEYIFAAMNINAAIENAQAIHNRDRNEIWWNIPCNGATLNNCTVVYDYVADAYAVYEGYVPSSMAMIRSTFALPAVVYGSYSGTISYFGSSLFGDAGQGITCIVQNRYFAPMGQSTEQQFRRLFLNVDPVGVTQPITVNLYPDYGSSIYASYTMYQSPFQSRIDFGVPAKSLSAEFIHVSASLPFKVNGFTIESRFQRAV